jgi:signal transduction histidine kinase
MYTRLFILSAIILAALIGLSWLGYRAIEIRAQGLEGARLGEFAEVAEQIRQDVKRKLDEFIAREQQRPWTDYQYYYVPENIAGAQALRAQPPGGQQQMPLLRSPLGSQLHNGLAYGNFQIEPGGNIVTPYYRKGQAPQAADDGLASEAETHMDNIKQNLLPTLTLASRTFVLPSVNLAAANRAESPAEPPSRDMQPAARKQQFAKGDFSQSKSKRTKQYPIGSLQEQQRAQIINQPRSVVESNVTQSAESVGQQMSAPHQEQESERQGKPPTNEQTEAQQRVRAQAPAQSSQPNSQTEAPGQQQQDETVQIRIEPFVPVVVPGEAGEQSVFDGQVFMLRRVQIEDRDLLQGFQLDEDRLLEEIEASGAQLIREGMTFDVAPTQSIDRPHYEAAGPAAYTALLDFGFGDVMVRLREVDPVWIAEEISELRAWYFSIIAVVLLAVILALASLWFNARAQIKLAQKKDDFISAVSHELRTPLTSIRMYSEMLEKNWVKSPDKIAEYYRSMRQEGERLSRLVENVLDFSRIQKGRKKYSFKLGNLNECIREVVDMMTPYAAEHGFTIHTDLGELEQTTFDADAVTQIVVNLLDNAVKYARDAEDKTITVRTRSKERFVLIEVQDHGPGVPHRQRKKIFEQFYRLGSEATRETTGTGLGLALVKKFAQAHNGSVEILTTQPTGVIFRVTLAARLEG